MAILKPWYKVVTPREDLRESRPLDASEFAVHLDQVRDGRAKQVQLAELFAAERAQVLDAGFLDPELGDGHVLQGRQV